MKVILIHSTDGGGGGGLVAYHLMELLCELGHESELYVGEVKLSTDKRVKYLSRRIELANKLANILPFPSKIRSGIRLLVTNITSPKALAKLISGKEFTSVYNTKKHLKNILKEKPDIIHCHNLHNNYFDLSSLVYLSQHVPTVITLHDAWLLTGHCAHFFDCEKWKTGCGNCPNLSVYPAIKKDATAYNWNKRYETYQSCKLYVTAPSTWILDAAHESMLNTGIVKSEVIPNGIDLNVFCPGNKEVERNALLLPENRFIIIFSASGLKRNDFKDYQCLRETLEILGSSGEDILCIALGDSGDSEFIGESVEIRFIPFISDAKIVAQYYQAADVYVHPAKADTFPTSVLEAEACGLPVVASAVCGIPGQIVEGETGYLVPRGDADMMADRILRLRGDKILRETMGSNAVILAKKWYDDKIMVRRYLEFYSDILLNLINYQ